MKKSELRRRITEVEADLFESVDFLTDQSADSPVFRAFFEAGFHVWLDEEPVDGADTPALPKMTSHEQGGKVRVGEFGPMYLISFALPLDDDEDMVCHLALPDLDRAPGVLTEIVRPFLESHVEDEFVKQAMLLIDTVPVDRLRELLDVAVARKVLES